MNIKRLTAMLLTLILLLIHSPSACETAYNESAQTYVSTSRGLTLSREEFLLLARLIHAEARGEPLTGQVAVGAVVFNRLQDPRFPKTIANVINEENQFSPVRDGSINLAPDGQALLAAELALNGIDPTGGCVFFYNPGSAQNKPPDNLPAAIQIGRHVFY